MSYPSHLSQDLSRRPWIFLWTWMLMWWESIEDSSIRLIRRPRLCRSSSCWILGSPVPASQSSCRYVSSITASANRGSFGLTENVVFVLEVHCRHWVTAKYTNEFLTNRDAFWKLHGYSWHLQQDRGARRGEQSFRHQILYTIGLLNSCLSLSRNTRSFSFAV